MTTCLVMLIMGLFLPNCRWGIGCWVTADSLPVRSHPVPQRNAWTPQSMQVFGWLYAVGGDRSGDNATSFFRVMSAIFGCIYVASSVALARVCGKDAAGRSFAFLMMIGVAPLLLFFGYAEHYAPATAGLATTLSHHLAGFCLVPLGVATVLHIHQSGRFTARVTTALGVGLALVGSLLAGWAIEAKAALLLPFAPHAPYAIWGPGHLGDALNGLLLMAPLHLVVITAGVASAGRRLFGDPVVLCLGAFTFAGAPATAVVDPALGALDWDLMSMFSIPLAGLTALCAGRYLPASVRVPGLIVVAAAIALHLVPWILVNHDPAQAVSMVEAMTRHDSHHDSERRMKLAVKFEHGGFGDAARRQYSAALQADDTNLAALRNLGFLSLPARRGGQRPAAVPAIAGIVAGSRGFAYRSQRSALACR